VRIFECVYANEVRQERECCRTDEPDRKPPNFALGCPLGSEDGSLRQFKDTHGVRIKYLAFRRHPSTAMGSRKEFQSKFVRDIGHALTARRLSNLQLV